MRKFKISSQVARKMSGLAPALPRDDGHAETAAVPETSRPIRVISRTDVGLVRKNNQDAVIIGDGLMGIADGMGGHNGGETAAISARDGMLRALKGKAPAERSEKTLEEAITAVNLALWEMQQKDESLSGMGTTLTVLWPDEEKMLIGHVGDSRAYLLRDGKIRQVTRDHSMVADMVRKGLLTEEQAATHPMRNYITRAVGTEPTVQVDLFALERQAGDRWLVCSDGLHGLVDRGTLENLMRMDDLDEAADEMIRQALDHGGRDNVSLVLAEDGGEVEA